MLCLLSFRRGLRLVLALTGLLCLTAPTLARPQIWFGADDPWVRDWKHRVPNDYMALFSGDGEWARNVDVLELSMQFAQWGQEDQLSKVIGFAKAHKLKIAVAGLMLVYDGGCGNHVEGYSGPNAIEKTAERFKSLGGVIDYITMDEPLYFGHVFTRGNACRAPISDVAAQVASHVKRLRVIFPSIKVGEDEPVGVDEKLHWLPSVAAWFQAYQAAAGEPLAFFHADIAWPINTWQRQLPAVASMARKAGVRFGITYNGDPYDPDDATWTAKASERAAKIEGELDLRPDDAVFFSWMTRPVALFPSTDRTTLTGVARCYVRAHGGGAPCF